MFDPPAQAVQLMRIEISFGKDYSGNEVVAALRSAAFSTEGCSFEYVPERIYIRSQKEREVFSNLHLLVGDHALEVLAEDRSSLKGATKYSGISINVPEGTDWDSASFEEELLSALEKGPSLKPRIVVRDEEEIEKRELTTDEINRIEQGEVTILALVQGEYGERIAENVQKNGPEGFRVLTMALPEELPLVIDDPREHLPESIPQADLVLALQENSSAAQLVAEIVNLSGAKALIAPVDNSQWLPMGMRTQIKRELSRMGVAMASPRPFCMLEPVGNPLIDKFAEYFGRPILSLEVEKKMVTKTNVVRDSPCGCGRFVAKELPGTHIRDAVEKAGLAHHHYPCLCSMNVEDDLEDTLMHFSGLQMKKTVDKELELIRKKEASYLDPKQM